MIFLDKYEVIYFFCPLYIYLSDKKVIFTTNSWVTLYFTTGFHIILAEILWTGRASIISILPERKQMLYRFIYLPKVTHVVIDVNRTWAQVFVPSSPGCLSHHATSVMTEMRKESHNLLFKYWCSSSLVGGFWEALCNL